jgi:chondroitin 4-sulfotransferase 11
MISHKHKCIYIHLPKTGGGSIERSLTGKGWASVKQYGRKVQHESAAELKILYRDWWKDYFKFSIARNPWDLMISHFMWTKRGKSGSTNLTPRVLRDFILDIPSSIKPLKFLDKNSKSTWKCDQHSFLYSPEGEPEMDFVGRFENLQLDFNIVCDKIGIPPRQLPHANKSEHKHYTEYYDDEARQIVAEKYAKDIEYFGYEF